MNTQIIEELSKELNVRVGQVSTVLKLLEEGNTIPFIARYRKEMTGSLDEEQIRSINERYEYQVNLLKRKEDVIRLIDEKGMLTEELKTSILKCQKLVEVEDLYRPYKEKKKTKATEAIANGLEPLAKAILAYKDNIYEEAKKYFNEKVKTVEEAITGASYIIAENISDNAKYRSYIRKQTFFNYEIASKKKKNAEDDQAVYQMYYDYHELIKQIKPHRILALNRGEKAEVLSVSVLFDETFFVNYLKKELKVKENTCGNIITKAIEDSLKRLILPSIEREIRSELSEKAEEVAINNFGKNLEKILLQAPMKEKNILGLDPAYRTGCKLAVIDANGAVQKISVIYPHEPLNKYEEAKKIVKDLILKHDISLVAIGNGTASRESEFFIADVLKDIDKEVAYVLVSEAGASVYSASKLAIQEFPDLHVEERSAISIARRLQDPLSELVKIDPKSIGVGLYQHDVTAKRLNETLDFVVKKTVNSVGVNVNTASESLLSYVSGLTKSSIKKIMDYKEKVGKIMTREELKKKKVLSDKVYEQAIGFLRIIDGFDAFDKTSIHPESYEIAKKILKINDLTKDDIGTEKIKVLNDSNALNETEIDIYASLISPMRDPRDEVEKPILRKDVVKLENLEVGMKLQGTVRNVVDFGAFIDIGIKNDGLVHISQICKDYIKHPSEVLSVGDIVDCYVLEVFTQKNKVALTLINNNDNL
ncbi:MAG: RNA-binding transcriptional accessory protein [Bacilli bacterium]|nr:RNA-binding transcriptional accessory protein [Bacilli bacterium]